MAVLLNTIARTIDLPMIQAYAQMTDDFDPAHLDGAFAAGTPAGAITAHQTLTVNLLWQAIASTFGNARAARSALDLRFVRPLFVGDTVEAGGIALAESEGSYRVWVRKLAGGNVIEGIARIPVEG